MKKKLIALFLVLALVLSLAACGGSETPPEKASADAGETEPAAGTETEDEVQEEEPAEEEPAQEEIDPKTADLGGTYWVCSGIVMDGELMDEETMEIFEITKEDLAAKMMLRFNADGTVTWMMEDVELDDEGNSVNTMIGETVPYEKDDTGISLNLMDLDITLEYQEKDLYWGSEEDGVSMGYLLSYVEEEPKAFAENADIAFHLEFTEEETIAMSSFMNAGLYLIEDQTVYGRFFGEESRYATFSKMSWTVDGSKMTMEEPVLLDEGCVAYYVTRYEDWIYYERSEDGNKPYQICRIRDDGTGKEVLYTEDSNYLSVHNGRLWFTNEYHYYCSMALDGSDMRVEYDAGEIYYPYFVDENWFICQMDADNESLHLINIEDGQDSKLNDERSYMPILIGSDVYYMYANSDGDERYLSKLNLNTLEVEHSENTILYGFASDGVEIHIACELGYLYAKPLAEYKDLSSNFEPGEDYNYVHYVNQDYEVKYEITDNGTKATMYLYYLDTGTSLPRVPGA